MDILESAAMLVVLGLPVWTGLLWIYLEISNRHPVFRILAGIATVVLSAYFYTGIQTKPLYAAKKSYERTLLQISDATSNEDIEEIKSILEKQGIN